MAKKRANADDEMDLSLTGSQVGTPASTYRSRPGSAKNSNRPSSGSGNRPSRNLNGEAGGLKGKTKGASTPLSGRSDLSSARTTGRQPKSHGTAAATNGTAKDDFLALFESESQPRVMKPKTGQKGSKTAWGSTTGADSARSVSTVDGGGDHFSHAHTANSKYSHSVFLPNSARSTSTVDAEDYANRNLNQDQRSKGMNDNSVTQQKVNSRSDLSFPSRKQRASTGSRENLLTIGQRPREEDLTASLNSRTSMHGGNEFVVNNQQDTLAQKATKLNSIANNMTSQAFSPGTKTPLMSLENSYQNIKPKTPVNQVRQVPQVGRNIAEDYVKTCNMAATKIQRWYRRHGRRRLAGEAAMKRLLDSKRQEKEQQLAREREGERNKEDDRKRIREEKARLARQSAIQELQKKREEKRLENQKTAEEEIRFLQASGKVSKTPAKKSNFKKKTVSRNKAQTGAKGKVDSDSDSEGEGSARPRSTARSSTGGSELFQNKGCGPSRSPAQPLTGSSDHGSDTLVLNKHGGEMADVGIDGDTPSQAATKTTLDDLMATLQKLEEDEKFPSSRKEKPDKNEKPLGWLDDLEKSDHSSQEGSNHDLYVGLSADKLQRLQGDQHHSVGGAQAALKQDNVEKSGLLTDEKLRSIMHYLDEVETAERLSEMDQELSRANDALDHPALLVPSGDDIQKLEQATVAASELTHQMLSQKMELEEKRRTASMLQKALNQQRELTVRHAKETEKEMKKRLDVQKDEYEETIKRHLSFIDQLIDDKKNLGEKCEQMVKELKTVDKKYQDKIKALQDTHDIEIRKLKEVQAAAEKLRREKWIDEKTKKIKEMTVKGLEPEIQRLIAKHKAEVKKIKSIHEAELLASDERAGGRYIKMTEELRDQLAQEKEAACARERELARQTYEKQLQQEEEAYQQQRRRLYTEVQEEKERLAQHGSRQRAELDRLQRQLEDSHSATSNAIKQEFEKAREEQNRRHQAEIRQLKEQLAAEKEAWEENHLKRQEAWAASKERELRDGVRKERDHEIELVIQRLEEDNQAARDECQRVADNRIKRIRDKYEGEIAELERSERQTTERYNQTKAKLAEVEGENERMKVTLKQKDREVQEVKRLLDKLNEERDHVSDVIRQEFADRLVATDEENKRVKNEMSELKARHRVELERAKAEVEVVQKSKEEEMDEVHKRVKQAIVKKEDVVTQLKQQYQAAVKRADHLEGLLEQQRKQLLSKK